jgi:hypothetical protein
MKTLKKEIKEHKSEVGRKIPFSLDIKTGTFSMCSVSIDVSQKQFMGACQRFFNELKNHKRKGYINLYMCNYFISAHFRDDGRDRRFKE